MVATSYASVPSLNYVQTSPWWFLHLPFHPPSLS